MTLVGRPLRAAVRRGLSLALLGVCACGTPRDGAAHAGPATRVISLVPAATEMLFAIGAGPRLIAVSSFDHYPPAVEKLPRVGALLDPDIERIIHLADQLMYAAKRGGKDRIEYALYPDVPAAVPAPPDARAEAADERILEPD